MSRALKVTAPSYPLFNKREQNKFSAFPRSALFSAFPKSAFDRKLLQNTYQTS